MSGAGDESRAEAEGALAFKNNLEEDMDCLDEDPSQHVLRAQRFALPATADATVAQWRAKHEAGLLAAPTFHDYWRVTVPRLYSPEPNRSCLDWSFDEERATALLLRPLQQFMCGGDPGEVMPRRLQSSSAVCGRVFKSGEPAYSCRECGMDNTCVLCVDCFKVSEHRNHKYKMGQSNGGGCCDCGDPEAWRRHPNCELHPADTELPEDSKELPADMAERVNLTLSVILGYCYRLLTLEHAPGLPNDLRLKEDEKDPLQILEQPDCYCTVLYNDETHTFEQVITTLTRMIKCTHRDAVEYVTNIDREGRAVVKCSSFQACNELKGEIEKFTSRHGHKSLKVLVMHAHVVAHQIYAMKLLQWLQNFVTGSEQLRKALATAALTLAEGVMQRDCQLWKAARTAWQRMLITTMLSDYASKRTLATLFTKNYASILKDFIRDDHDHTYSVSSLSVQLYTTPTLAHHLIAEQDALYNVLNTFYSECARKCNKQGRLEFERNMSPAFKRAQFILYDVKYLLTAPPAEWTNPLRSGFLHGIAMLLKLLACMQGMDAVSRQVGQHMEFEPEWESAFNLHVKLSHGVSLALQWCASDRVVLAKAYRLALKKLHETESVVPGLVKELGDHSASVIPYDVSSEPVSIHLPLSRFLAGLHLLLHQHGLAFDGPEFNMPKLTPEQIIEPVLRTAAMIAQVHAGMWRRNGYALLNQLFFYHNVKCRPEMLDRDIVLLQVGASLVESNEFVIHTLNKLGLLVWAAPDFEATSLRAPEEDSMRQTISLVEEFLGLLITIIGSRHVPGVGEVTAAERTKKEIVQQLCVRPMAHSELNRALPEDELHETGMEAVIDEIADFNKPTSGQGKGVYTLKTELFDDYDTFFYHYTREELSRSEEEQRKRRKLARLPECCPPPRLPKLAPPFTMVANLVQCDAALHVMRVVLQRALDLRARSFSETQLHKVLHLMGYGLRDEESGHYEFVAFAARASRAGLPALLQQLATSPRVDAHRTLILWTVQKFKSVLGESSEEKSSDVKMDTDESANKASTEDTEDADKAWRAKMAAQRRAKVMAQMEALQKNFMSNNAQLFEETETGRTVSTSSSETLAAPTTCGAALSANARTAPVTESPRTCIMCQEDAAAEPPAPPLVLVAFVQQSTVLARHRSGHDTSIPPDDPLWLEAGLRVAPHVSSCGHVMHADCWQKYIDNVILKENRRPYRLRQPASFDVDKQEYLCPLCERLCNTALPLLPATPPAPPQAYEPLPFHAFVQGLRLALKYKVSSQPMHVCSEQCAELHCRASRSTSAILLGNATDAADAKRDDAGAAVPAYYVCHARREIAAELGVWGEQFLEVFTGSVPEYSADMKDLIQLLSQATYTIGLNANPHTGDPRAPLALWRATAYTLLSADALLHAERRPLLAQLAERHRHCLQALVRISCAMGPTWPKNSEIGSHALRLAGAALDGSPLQWDALGLLVPLAAALPALFAAESRAAPAPATVSRHATRLVLMALMTRVLVTADYEALLKDEAMDMEGEMAVEEAEVEGCSKLMDMVKLMQRGRVDLVTLSLEKIWKQVQEGCRSYLRCCCLFFHFVSGVESPAGLTQLEGDTWPVMCAYLALPDTFDELFDSEVALELALGWSRHEEVDKFFAGQIEVATVREPRQPPGLVALPADFSELINAVSLFTCPNSEREDSKYPTMCLVCNEMLCSQSYCCQTELNKTLVGACVAHAASCGAGACLFLRVRECETLLLAAPSRGCTMPAPYRDCYGETDQGLRRGNPLQLCRERYEAQRLLWLSHGVYERIARSIETGSLIPTMWQHM